MSPDAKVLLAALLLSWGVAFVLHVRLLSKTHEAELRHLKSQFDVGDLHLWGDTARRRFREARRLLLEGDAAGADRKLKEAEDAMAIFPEVKVYRSGKEVNL